MKYETKIFVTGFSLGVIFTSIAITLALFAYEIVESQPFGGLLLNESQAREYVWYNVTELEYVARNKTEIYFDADLEDVEIKHFSGDHKSRSQAVDFGYREKIDMFLRRSKTWYTLDIYHELCHTALWDIKVDHDDNNGNYIHESVCTAYSVFIAGKSDYYKFYGLSSNSEEAKPYYFIISQLEEDNNFDCLDGVFVKWDKISDEEELKKRFEKECDIDWEKI